MPKPRSATLTPLQTRHAKRMRDQLDEIETTIVNTHNKKPRGYDKQPRRRTREDRYEYHAPDITGGRIHRDRKPSKVRRGRKGTINDRFRASNVARSRLTVSDRDAEIIVAYVLLLTNEHSSRLWPLLESSTRGNPRPPCKYAMINTTMRVMSVGQQMCVTLPRKYRLLPAL